MKRFFIDTNVALDLLLAREPYLADALFIFALADNDKATLLLSTDSLSTIFYVIEKNKNASIARGAISKLLDYVQLCALDESSVIEGLALNFTDIEDAFICSVAMRSKADVIVTRNVKDFTRSPIPVRGPNEIVAALKTIN